MRFSAAGVISDYDLIPLVDTNVSQEHVVYFFRV